MKDEEIVQAIRRMYIVENDIIKRVQDCSLRDYATHENCGENVVHMKIKTMNTRDIVYIIHFGVMPNGRVIYKDGNRLNHSKDNITTVSKESYHQAVNLALKILADSKPIDLKIESPKDFKTYLAGVGLKEIGKNNAYAIIKNSNLERVQRGRAENMIRELS